MITASALGSFALIVGLLTLTPGIDTALILRTAVTGRSTRAWGVVLGIQTGTLVWGVLGALGVTAVLTASHLAYTALRWAGAAYLVWMGARMVWATLRRRGGDAGPAEEADSGGGFWSGWRKGALTNLLNPKVGAFYMAVLPQFVPEGGAAAHLLAGALLAGVHIALGVIWSGVLILFARTLRDTLRRPSARRVLDRVTGTVIAAFGARLAFGE
ncbi:threonine/homoserine/homoserine lactone efflux protein [Streptomyces canus]|uniref:LysE family translocator n=1 Tax=Streptomyces canus TaxID=58343 RepID=UPI00278933BC|nr:LysE family translocator [Streptomyces canus]MDQ0598711.1 threonine/homoserine/homoserine lactone efflux protein [Streptomyces canus]